MNRGVITREADVKIRHLYCGEGSNLENQSQNVVTSE